jgi:hypothetical protein
MNSEPGRTPKIAGPLILGAFGGGGVRVETAGTDCARRAGKKAPRINAIGIQVLIFIV